MELEPSLIARWTEGPRWRLCGALRRATSLPIIGRLRTCRNQDKASLVERTCDARSISNASAQAIELPVNILTARNRPGVPFRLSSISEPMSHCSAAAGGAGSYDAINLKVPSARETENWEAGQNPALPPQRWWSEAWRIKPLGRSTWEGAMGLWKQGRSRARKPALGT